MAISHIKSNIIADFTGTVTVFNSAGSTQTVEASQLVRPSDWNSAHNQYLTLSGNTLGASTMSGSNIIMQGGANITLSANGDTLVLSGPAAGGMGVSAGTQSVSTGTMIFADSNGLTFGMSGSSQITGSYSQSTHSHATAAFSGSNGSFTANTVTFGALNNLTFYTSNGSIVGSFSESTHSHASPAFSGSNGSFTANTVTFGNLNGLSFYTSNGSMVGSHNALTTAAASDHSHGNPTLALTNINGTTASNSAGFTLSLSAAGGAGDGVNVLAAGTRTAQTTGTVLFDNANGITFGLNAVGGSIMTASHNAITTARASTDAIGLNTAQTNVTWTVNSSGLSFNAAGYAGTTTAITGRAAITMNSGGFQFNGSGIAGTGFTSTTTAGTAIVATNSTNGLSLAFPSFITNALTTARASNDAIGLNTAQTNVTWTVNSSGLSLNAAGYAGTGTTFQGNNASGSMTLNSAGLNLSVSVAAPGAAAENNWVHLLGANTAGNTTASGSTIGLSGLGVTLSGTNGSVIVVSGGGGGGSTQSGSYPYLGAVNVIGVPGQHSMAFAPINAAAPFQFDRICIPVLFSNATNSSNSWSLSLSVGIFSRNVSSLSLIASTSTGASGTASGTAGSYSIWGGPRILTIGMTSTLGGQNLWIGVWSKTSANAGGQTLNLYLASNNNSNFSGIVGAASSTHMQLLPGLGHYSATFSSAMPAAFSMSQIQGTGSLQQRPVALYFASQTV